MAGSTTKSLISQARRGKAKALRLSSYTGKAAPTFIVPHPAGTLKSGTMSAAFPIPPHPRHGKVFTSLSKEIRRQPRVKFNVGDHAWNTSSYLSYMKTFCQRKGAEMDSDGQEQNHVVCAKCEYHTPFVHLNMPPATPLST
jgi:hypothetical protein